MDNRRITEEREAVEKRRKAAEEAKANRSRAAVDVDQGTGDTSVLDNLLEKLRNGDSVGRKSRRNRAQTGQKPPTSLTIDVDESNKVFTGTADLAAAGDNPGALARDMLAALKSDGFEAFTPTRPRAERTSGARRRSRRQRSTTIAELEDEALMSDGPPRIPGDEEEDDGTPQDPSMPTSPAEGEIDEP